jgi:hypothetical protein
MALNLNHNQKRNLELNLYEALLQDVRYEWIDTDEDSALLNLTADLSQKTKGFRIDGRLKYKGRWDGK